MSAAGGFRGSVRGVNMNDNKSLGRDSVEQVVARLGSADKDGTTRTAEPTSRRLASGGQVPLRSVVPDEIRRGRGRLNRETLNRLGKVLETYFDDIRRQGVPDRFRRLLEQLDKHSATTPALQHVDEHKDEETN